jgi:hypothetical protein
MDLLAQALILNLKIEHAAERGGTAAAATEPQVKAAFGHYEGNLKLGRDYTGDGSREMPFCLRSSLQSIPASRMLLNQRGIKWTGRQMKSDAVGRLCDCYQAADQDWWFVIPNVQALEL